MIIAILRTLWWAQPCKLVCQQKLQEHIGIRPSQRCNLWDHAGWVRLKWKQSRSAESLVRRSANHREQIQHAWTALLLEGRTCTRGAPALDHLVHRVDAVAAQVGRSLLRSARAQALKDMQHGRILLHSHAAADLCQPCSLPLPACTPPAASQNRAPYCKRQSSSLSCPDE